MYILVVLDVLTHEVTIVDAINDELVAQNEYLNKISDLAMSTDPYIEYESIMITKTKTHIVSKVRGWTGSTKTINKIVTLHHESDYEVVGVNQ